MRRSRLLLVLLLLVVVNIPPVHAAWTDHRLDGDGVTETVPAVTDGGDGDATVVEVSLPTAVAEELGGAQGLLTQPTALEPDAYADAAATGQVEVTYLPEDPGTYRVEGASGGLALATVLLANAALLLVVGLFLLVRGRTRPELRMVATADVRRVPPGALLERVNGNDYVVRGDIEELADDELVLQVADRRVRVLLDGHANPASYQQSVEVRGTMIG